MDNTSSVTDEPAAADAPIASVKILKLPVGTYRITVTDGIDTAPLPEEFSGSALQISPAPVLSEGSIEISGGLGTFERWLRRRDDWLMVRIHGGSASVLLTSMRSPSSAAMSIDIRLLHENEVSPPEALVAEMGSDSAAPVVPLILLAHIQGTGDMEFRGGRAASADRNAWIEGFAARPEDSLVAGVVEYSAVRADGVVLPWTDAGSFCGSRGEGLPIVGFALRVKPSFAQGYECVYGAMFASGRTCDSMHDGAMCQSILADDPVTAIEIKIFELRGTAAQRSMQIDHQSAEA